MSLESPAGSHSPVPDVFTTLLLVAMLLLAGGIAWMVLVNTEHSKLDDRSEGGPIVLIDQR